ncbi:Txe/YoeB family addiction module toxin [Secundilactobacillus kimchicus]|uniref:Txe/YoeB family addiction module toxin n=1 Tax=Secundilactobacillus kimchicus TaxID=528209 RepID=UPI0007048DCD|nr:Txe/YoeB family addiction module toxin [Secundilactobacillus kimchicus]
MIPYEVEIKNSAKGDLKKLKQSNLKDQFLKTIAILKHDPFQPTQSFEKLQPPSSQLYSRRLNAQHRVVYRVDITLRKVYIYSAWSHYE